MWKACILLTFPWLLSIGLANGQNLGWHFVQNGTSGLVALEAIVVSPTLAILFDRATNDPLQINNHTTWGALWNFETNTATPLDLITDSFCASGSILSNGTMVSLGGNPSAIPEAGGGLMGVRIFEPCSDPAGTGCTIFENPKTHHLAESRWYPSSLRIFDGSLMVVGGTHLVTSFYNTDPANTIEFFPPKDNGVPRPSPFLERALPANLFPRAFALPSGKIFIIANNRSVIYDVETDTETQLPDVPNGVRVTNPFDGTATLLPLSPPDYIPEVLVCGGSTTHDSIPSIQLSSQDLASDQCSRMVLTPEGIKKGWQVEKMLEPRVMPEMILLPNGEVLIINGGRSGYAALNSTRDPIGSSNADHPVFTPSLYMPHEPLGKRFSNVGLPTTDIPRLYHSTATLTPMGNIFVGGSNPNRNINNDTHYHSELRIEYLNPPYMTVARPKLLKVPPKIAFNQEFTTHVSIPSNLKGNKVQVALMDLGFSSHAFHSSSRLVFMDAKLSNDRKTLTMRSPPNNRVYPPGPAFIYVTIDNVASTGIMVLVGDGANPPVRDQGVSL